MVGMAKDRAQTIIERPAEVVWAKVGDFADVTWIPRTQSSTLEGDDRSVRMEGMDFDLVQRLLERDDTTRSYRYCLANPGDLERAIGREVPGLEAVIAVTPNDESSCTVTWDVEAADFMVAGAAGEYQRALENLKAILEG
jgi:hypothetical protein